MNRDIGRTRKPGKAVLHLAVPGGGQAFLLVERDLGLRLMERRLRAGIMRCRCRCSGSSAKDTRTTA